MLDYDMLDIGMLDLTASPHHLIPTQLSPVIISLPVPVAADGLEPTTIG